jgi:phage tail-like protein
MPDPVLFPDHYFKISLPGIEFVHHLPGRVRYPYLTLSRGLTDQDALQQWFWQTRQQPELKEITVELHTPDSGTTRAWVFADAFPVRWTGPNVAVHAAGMATESLDIAHSGLKVA